MRTRHLKNSFPTPIILELVKNSKSSKCIQINFHNVFIPQLQAMGTIIRGQLNISLQEAYTANNLAPSASALDN